MFVIKLLSQAGFPLDGAASLILRFGLVGLFEAPSLSLLVERELNYGFLATIS